MDRVRRWAGGRAEGIRALQWALGLSAIAVALQADELGVRGWRLVASLLVGTAAVTALMWPLMRFLLAVLDGDVPPRRATVLVLLVLGTTLGLLVVIAELIAD